MFGDSSDEKQPGLNLRHLESVPINASTLNLPDSYFDLALCDIEKDDIHYSALKETYTELDIFEVNWAPSSSPVTMMSFFLPTSDLTRHMAFVSIMI